MKRSFFDELYQRWKAETPEFFKKIRTLGLFLLVVAGLVVGINEVLGDQDTTIPPVVVKWAKIALLAGGLVSGTATLPVKPEYQEAVKYKDPDIPTVSEIKKEIK